MSKIDLDKSIEYLDYIMSRFYPIGADKNGGVTRLAYTKEEDLMHDELARIGQEEGFIIETDQVGNTLLSSKDFNEYFLIGSHLDSVVNGGRFDGVIGVAAGILLLKIIKEEKLDIPLKVVALRCEESSNFMKSTVGSGLITDENSIKDFDFLKSRDGKSLEKIFEERGYKKTPSTIKGVKGYLELHIEQGRVLENEELKIGIVTSIAGNTRFRVKIKGLAEHSGATPMGLRKDALCGTAEIILGIESLGQGDFSSDIVTTVGVIDNFPNSLNVIPGETSFSVDIRDGENHTMENMKKEIEKLIKDVCNRRALRYDIELLSSSSAVSLNEEVFNDLSEIAHRLGINHKKMSSGAGHDAMKFADITKTGMVFIPCKDGISHNPEEYASLEDAAIGSKIILEYLKRGIE